MTSLREKFGKFAVSSEKMAMVSGGVMAVCTENADGSGAEWLIAAEDVNGLQELVNRDGGHCTTVEQPNVE